MKQIIYTVAILLAGALASCSDFLETPPSVELDENGVFADRTLTEQYLTGVYAEGMPLGFSMSSSNTDRGLSDGALWGACDEAEDGVSYAKSNSSWNVDNHNNNSIDWDEDPRHNLRWETLRKCNTILERIDEVPYDQGDPDFNRRTKGEAYFMRALVFWEGVYRYGGLPILHHRLAPSDFAMLPRNSFSDCVDSILIDCDRAAALLPDYYTDVTKKGRATRIAALALKSRVLLYAASPLFNTNEPYISFKDPANNKLIGYGDYNQERWKKAADAAKTALDAVAASGFYGLYTDGTPETNYEYVWSTPDNKEVILANKKYRNFKVSARPLATMLPTWANNKAWDASGTFPTLNFVKFYQQKDGSEANWNMKGGDDLLTIYKSLDPRFEQTMVAQGIKWNDEVGEMDFTDGGTHKVSNDKTRHTLRKWTPRTLKVTPPLNSVTVDWIVFRVAELYLNYAEALNESMGSPSAEAYAAVNIIRQRSGMPDLKTGMDKNQFREAVRRERAIELAFEGHRFWDIRRWMIAEQEGVMQGKMYGLRTSKIIGSTKIHYEPEVFETRSWSRRSYLHPIKQKEVDKGYMLQNPGW